MMKILTEYGYGRFEVRRVRTAKVPKLLTPQQEEKRRINKEKRRIKREAELARQEVARKARRAMFKPCPFCGSNLADIPYPGDISAFVQCPKCDATGGSARTDEEAIANWNKRSPLTP